MDKKVVVIIVVFLVLVFCSVCGAGSIYLIPQITKQLDAQSQDDEDNTGDNQTSIPTDDINFNFDNTPSAALPDLNNDNITTEKAERIDIISLEFLTESYNLAKANNWNGDEDTLLPFKLNDYDKTQLDKWVERANEKDSNLDIPSDLEDLYLSSQAQQEITEEVFKARNEYLQFLKDNNVHQDYIDEFNKYTLPDDRKRLTYIAADDPNSPVTGVSAYDADPREQKYELHTIDIYLPSLIFKRSGVVGSEPSDPQERIEYYKLLRNLGIRMTSYHEFTHALQIAANYVNTEDGFKYPTISIQSVNTSPEYNWGNTTLKEVYNESIAEESQADGVAFLAITSLYNMSESQKSATWDHFFGRLENGQQLYHALVSGMDKDYPNYDPWGFPGKLQEDVLYKEKYGSEPASTLLTVTDGVDMAAYGGYLNPMTPDRASEFWKFLRTTHR